MAGVTVRLDPDDPQSVVLRFFDKDGIDVDETTQRKIERLYHREDFRRVLAREIGDLGFPPRTARALHRGPDRLGRPLRGPGAGLKLVLDYSFGTASFVMPNLLAKLEAEVLVVNPYANTASVLPSTARPAPPGCPTWCGPRAPIWGPCSTPGASSWTSSTTRATPSADDEALLVLSPW